jgi:heme/copper-type cytochrome/quinol oxidase subunit 2
VKNALGTRRPTHSPSLRVAVLRFLVIILFFFVIVFFLIFFVVRFSSKKRAAANPVLRRFEVATF